MGSTGIRRQAGFIPGVVMEINLALAALALAVVVLWSWADGPLRPPLVDANDPALVAPAAGPNPVPPQAWTLTHAPNGSVVLQRAEPVGLMWIIPILIAAALVVAFVLPLMWPFWLALAILCAVWTYANSSDPVSQSITLAKDGSVTWRTSARFAGIIGRSQSVAAKDIENVRVHKDRPEVYIVYLVDTNRRRGLRLYADSAADAHAIAALALARLKIGR